MNAKQKIELCTIRELFEDTEKKLYVPNYLRTYTWDTSNLKDWIIDLQKFSQLHLGYIILEKTNSGHAVIKGQQCLATSLIFLSTANENIIESYFDHFSLGDADNDFFQNVIRNGTERQAQTSAQECIQKVHKYSIAAKEYLNDYTHNHIYGLYRKLLNSTIFVNTAENIQSTTARPQLRNDWFWKPVSDKEEVSKVKESNSVGSKFKIEPFTIQELLENKKIGRFITGEHLYCALAMYSEQDFLICAHENLERQYYLGRILFEETAGIYTVIDGKQYLITILILLSMANKDQFHHYFGKYSLDDSISDFFQACIKNAQKIQAKTNTQQWIKELLENSKNKISTEFCQAFAEKLLQANIAVITASDKAKPDLFRLGNYSGVFPPILEELKASLVHQIQLCTEDPEEKLAELAECFAEINLVSYQLRCDPEDIIVAHYDAFMSPDSDPYNKYNGYDIFLWAMEAYFQEYKDKNQRVDVIIEYCKELTISFENIKKLEHKKMKEYQDTFRYLHITNYVLPFILCEMKKRSTKDLKTLLKVLAELVVRQGIVHWYECGYDKKNDFCVIDIRSYHRLGWLLEKYRKECDPDLLSARLYQGFEGEYKEIEYNWHSKNSKEEIFLLWSKEFYSNHKGRRDHLHWLTPFFLYQYELHLKKGRVDWDEESLVDWDEGSERKHEILLYPDDVMRCASFLPSAKINSKGNSQRESKKNPEMNKLLREKCDCIGNKILLEESLVYKAAKQPFPQKLEIYKESKLAQANEMERFATKDKEDIEAWALDILENREKHLIEFIQNSYAPDENSKKLGMF